MEKEQTGINIEEILNQEITNVICIKMNEPNIDLMSQAFYDIYIRP